jgi:hypothetical protein
VPYFLDKGLCLKNREHASAVQMFAVTAEADSFCREGYTAISSFTPGGSVKRIFFAFYFFKTLALTWDEKHRNQMEAHGGRCHRLQNKITTMSDSARLPVAVHRKN